MQDNSSICRQHSVEAAGRQLLARLESVLAMQLRHAADNKLDEVAALAGEADSLLARLGGVDISADPSLDDAVRRVAGLHRRLILSLATQKQEASSRLKHLHRGKTTLRGYQTGC